MKDVKTLQRYVLEAISARALTVESDKELGQYCLSPGSKVKKVEEDERDEEDEVGERDNED
jgi:hypothetical protein